MRRVAVSTTDNPFNPLTDYANWYRYDEDHGYHTSAYLGRILRTSDELSEADQAVALESAVDEIVEFNLLGSYIKVIEEPEDAVSEDAA